MIHISPAVSQPYTMQTRRGHADNRLGIGTNLIPVRSNVGHPTA